MSPSPRFRPSYRLSDLWRAPLHDFPIRDEIVRQYLTMTATMNVLEIGPGSGLTAFRLSRQVSRLTLVEVSESNVARLRQTFGHIRNIDIVWADATDPELPRRLQATFDAAYGLEVFAYIPDREACLRNLGLLLRPGAELLLQFPNYPQPLRPELTVFRTREDLDSLLEKAGFAEWGVWALSLRPYAGALFHRFVQRPLQLYRRWNQRKAYDHAAIYEQTWVFRHHHRLERYKLILNSAWLLLSLAIRLGGDCFQRHELESDVRNRNLLVIARR